MEELDQDTSKALSAIAAKSRSAARELATTTADIRDGALHALSEALLDNLDLITEANQRDLEAGRQNGMSSGLLDRLTLSPARLEQCAASLLGVASQADPLGEVISGKTLPNGLKLRQVRVPIGVVGMIYEARPNVTVDVAGLALKSGNAVILRGGSAAATTNQALIEVMRGALESVNLPSDALASIDDLGRAGARALMQAHGEVDVLVPRGGKNLIQTVVNEAKVPVIETGSGNCHVYVDEAVDIDEALRIVLNAKVSRYSVCNAAETLLVNEHRAGDFLPLVLAELLSQGVKIHGDEQVLKAAPLGSDIVLATESDWEREYLDLEMAIAVVADIDEAIAHINRYSSGHTEAICTSSITASEQFIDEVDSAVVNVNASTRFTDGGEFGLGAELGISTQKLHARGPMGLSALTTSKWTLFGNGQIRE